MRNEITSDWQTEIEDNWDTIIEAPLRRPNTMPKVLTCRKGKYPLTYWTSVVKDKGIIHIKKYKMTDMTYPTFHFKKETKMLREIQ